LESKRGQLCGAKTRQGTPCQRKSLDNGRCILHGGRNNNDVRETLPDKRPPGRPPTHGKYSKYLKDTLFDKISEFENDKMFLDLRSEIAIIRALIAKRLDEDSIDEAAFISLTDQAKKLAQVYMAIEKDRKFALSHEEVIRILREIANILDKHIQDEVLLQLIVKDIEGIKI